MNKEKLDEIAEVFTNQSDGYIKYSFEETVYIGEHGTAQVALIARVAGIPPLGVILDDVGGAAGIPQARASLKSRVLRYLLYANAQRHESTKE